MSTPSERKDFSEFKLLPEKPPHLILIREIVIYILGFIGCIIYTLPILKELILDFSNFTRTFFSKPSPGPPANLYQKQPNSDKDWHHKEVVVNGVNFHYVEEGDPSHQTMLFLHGFPEFWYSWRYQLVHFAKSYRVIAIDLKGYAESDKPQRVSAYSAENLLQDVIDLIVELQKSSTATNKKVIIVGHDWGGFLSWWTAICTGTKYIDRLVILNCPHPLAFSKNADFGQRLAALYMFFFAVPVYPEKLLCRKNFDFIRICYQQPGIGLVHQERLTPDDLKMYVWAFSRPGAITAALNYYRNVVRGIRLDLSPKVEVPTLVLWGEKDMVLKKNLNDNLERWVPQVSIKFIPDASHWINQDTPEIVNEEMGLWLEQTK